jgi:glucose-6-phosphate isomerase
MMDNVLFYESFKTLKKLAGETSSTHLRDFFTEDPSRYDHFHRTFESNHDTFLLDFSKQRVNQPILDALSTLADNLKLKQWIDLLFSNQVINHTEQRAAMHWALRVPKGTDWNEPEPDLYNKVHEQLDKMAKMAHKLQSGQQRGCTGEVITNVVNIGVGGSDLGPLMVCQALEDWRISTPQNLQIHFVSSMDGSQLSYLLHELRPETTLFVISSKSFTTIDTLSNADTARNWLSRKLGYNQNVMRCHFIGVSTKSKKMTEWGIEKEHQLKLWDWVGGRYSLWSAIGFPIALMIGVEGFKSLLAGAHAMDQHFRTQPWQHNIPALLGLLGVWNTNFLNIKTQAILPYDGRLKHLSAYLQQLEMESNGKSIGRDGKRVKLGTCPIIWGDVGPNAQHAFYQLLHQGTETITCDFIAPALRYHDKEKLHAEAAKELQVQHQLALANCFAQSRLLALGEAASTDQDDYSVYKNYQGNQPSSTILLKELNPFSLGMLLAAYEHKVFVQSVIWQINPFDQWGVEMGKEIAKQLLPAVQGNEAAITDFDASTNGLLSFVRKA